MPYLFTRREALKRMSVAVGSMLTVISGYAAASNHTPSQETTTHLEPQDPDAQELSYHEIATTVNEKEFPQYKPGQRCGMCVALGGNDGDRWRPCVVMSGKLVSANGWCKAFYSKV
jgi:hypothetical protein